MKRGFTLIELLVVIAVIALLAGLVIATTTLVRRSAQNAVCASRLQQWGLAIAAYGTDNEELIPHTMPDWGSNNPALGRTFWAVLKNQDPARPESINFPKMQQYFSMPDQTANRLPAYWNCNSSPGFVADQGSSYPCLWTSYMYFAGSSAWESWTNASSLLTDKRLEAKALLMADRFAWSNSQWYANHPFIESPNGLAELKGLRQNQLFGDGRVELRSAANFPMASMANGAAVGNWAVADTANNRAYF